MQPSGLPASHVFLPPKFSAVCRQIHFPDLASIVLHRLHSRIALQVFELHREEVPYTYAGDVPAAVQVWPHVYAPRALFRIVGMKLW